MIFVVIVELGFVHDVQRRDRIVPGRVRRGHVVRTITDRMYAVRIRVRRIRILLLRQARIISSWIVIDVLIARARRRRRSRRGSRRGRRALSHVIRSPTDQTQSLRHDRMNLGRGSLINRRFDGKTRSDARHWFLMGL